MSAVLKSYLSQLSKMLDDIKKVVLFLLDEKNLLTENSLVLTQGQKLILWCEVGDTLWKITKIKKKKTLLFFLKYM